MEKRKTTRKKTELPVKMTILNKKHTGSVRNYSFDGAFVKIADKNNLQDADLLHKDISFVIDENSKYAVRPKGKIVRIFATEKGLYLAVRFLDYMKEEE